MTITNSVHCLSNPTYLFVKTTGGCVFRAITTVFGQQQNEPGSILQQCSVYTQFVCNTQPRQLLWLVDFTVFIPRNVATLYTTHTWRSSARSIARTRLVETAHHVTGTDFAIDPLIGCVRNTLVAICVAFRYAINSSY